MDLIDDLSLWQACWSAVCPQGDGQACRAELIQRYAEPHRAYHAAQHLKECLALWAAHRGQARHPAALYWAIWFHDAVYDTRADDNEQASADLALRHLSAGGAAPATLRQVQALVLATRHAAEPADADQALLVDIDLAILGADAPRFAQYQEQIRQEYGWVPADVYATRRAAVLQGFLSRPHIYTTAHFRQTREPRARHNLSAALR